MWQQRTLVLRPRPRGFHLITDEILATFTELAGCRIGLLHLFIQHTSASLAVNENADPDVRGDLERHFRVLAPERASHYRHLLEGDDDMPAHIKNVLIGSSLSLPVRAGRLALGTWQGIYLCEHRERAGARTLIATLQGEGDVKPG